MESHLLKDYYQIKGIMDLSFQAQTGNGWLHSMESNLIVRVIACSAIRLHCMCIRYITKCKTRLFSIINDLYQYL